MQKLIDALRSLPAEVKSLHPPLSALSDAELVRETSAAIGRPKAERRSSFTLHAPIELPAREILLSLTPLEHRDVVRCRIAAIAAEYAEGDEIEAPSTSFDCLELAETALLDALRTGAPDQADAGHFPIDHQVTIERSAQMHRMDHGQADISRGLQLDCLTSAVSVSASLLAHRVRPGGVQMAPHWRKRSISASSSPSSPP